MIQNDRDLWKTLFDKETEQVANYALASSLLKKGIVGIDSDTWNGRLSDLLTEFYFDVDVVKSMLSSIVENADISNGSMNTYLGETGSLASLLGVTPIYLELLKKVVEQRDVVDAVTTYLYTRLPNRG